MLQVQAINKFVNNRNLPPELCEDISRHVETSQVMHQEQGDADVFSTLSHTLQVGCWLSSVPCPYQLLCVTGAWHTAALSSLMQPEPACLPHAALPVT